jgi:hypothetical protein
MEKLQLDSDKYVLYSPDSLNYITEPMFTILDDKVKEYKELFGVKSYRKITINYFDDKDKFREFIYNLRGEIESLPKYAIGTFDDGMINAYVPLNVKIGSIPYCHYIHMASHELFHLMYRELILENDSSKRITWYDEGMAQLVSGQMDYLSDDERFLLYFEAVKSETKKIPIINEIKQGNSFRNEDYDGYPLSYLSVRYLQEILPEDEFKQLLGNFDLIKEYGKNIIKDMFDYYSNQKTKNL